MNRVFYLYHDSGVGNDSFIQTFQMLKAYGNVNIISHKNIINDELSVFDSTLVMPGGADLPYMLKLKGKGNAVIKKNVILGMNYIGICAGAYYAAEAIHFENYDGSIISGCRELKFFPDVVKGPHLAKYTPNSLHGARAARVFDHCSNRYLSIFYNGGGVFENVKQYSGIKVCASYADNSPAVVFTKYGIGKVLLSGLHYEYDPQDMQSRLPREMACVLVQDDFNRRSFIKSLFTLM